MRVLSLSLMVVAGALACCLATGIAGTRASPPRISPDTQPDGQSQQLVWFDPWPEVLTYTIQQDSDDGTEMDSLWCPGGFFFCLNCIGSICGEQITAGMRFSVPDLEQGQFVKYARLRLAAQGGLLTSSAVLRINGADEDSSGTFSETRRPSQLPKTSSSVSWVMNQPWKASGSCLGLYYGSPNLAPIINEILARPNWGMSGDKALILTIEDDGCPPGEINYLQFEDYSTIPELRDAALLEVYATLADAFVGKPILGRPTDTSVTVNVIHLLPLDVYVEYSMSPAGYNFETAPLLDQPAGEPIEIEIENLHPDKTYYYRIRYREPGDIVYLEGMEGSFHTQRAAGSMFVFTIQADSHVWELMDAKDEAGLRLYEQTLQNVALDNPDFHIAMGDFAHPEIYIDRDVYTSWEAVDRYLEQRKYLDKVLHSIPFYLVLGNHDGEQGWRLVNPDDSVAIWGAWARKKVIPNPAPDDFYSGDTTSTACCGRRENYYAWQWGDVLFVVLDPFWYTPVKPHENGGGEGSEDPWDWTLGKGQYDWLYETLHTSTAPWKFTLTHHLAGGVRSPSGLFKTPYGRGGIEAAKYKVDKRGSYEWGGEDELGQYRFADKRPGWAHGAVHDILVSEGVTFLFHGHDHVFVHQTLDGVVYQACPQPSDSGYTDGWYDWGLYSHGTKQNNSGHVRVTVRQDYLQVHYVRSVLPEDEPLVEDGRLIFNGDVTYSYTVGTASLADEAPAGLRPRLIQNRPNPFASSTWVEIHLPSQRWVSLEIHDVRGRLVRRLLDGPAGPGMHRLDWDGRCDLGKPTEQGIYFCRLNTADHSETCKMVLLR